MGHASVTVAKLLLTQAWPANAQADVHTLGSDVEKVSTDIQAGDQN
jgi:hypothetical protein